MDELDGDCNTQLEHGRMIDSLKDHPSPAAFPAGLEKKGVEAEVRRGVGMECNLRKSMGRLVESDRESQITFDTDITLSSDKHSNGEGTALLNVYC